MVRDLRVAQGPLLMAIATLDKTLSAMRVAAKSLSFSYPIQPPKDQIIGPSIHPNQLAYTFLPSLKIPHLLDITVGCRNLMPEDADTVRRNLLNISKLDFFSSWYGI